MSSTPTKAELHEMLARLSGILNPSLYATSHPSRGAMRDPLAHFSFTPEGRCYRRDRAPNAITLARP
jgi:hypothetical protein